MPADAPTAAPLLLSAARLAELLDTSPATIWRWDSAGKLPRPLRLSAGTTRWRRSDVEAWIAAGCPPRAEWEALVADRNGHHPA